MQMELRYELSKKDQVSARFSGNLNGNDRDGLTATAHLDELELTTLRYDRLARQNGDGSSSQARIAWEHTWVPERHGLEVDASIHALTSIVEPIMMIGVGLVVGIIIIAMYMPMFKLLQLVE